MRASLAEPNRDGNGDDGDGHKQMPVLVKLYLGHEETRPTLPVKLGSHALSPEAGVS